MATRLATTDDKGKAAEDRGPLALTPFRCAMSDNSDPTSLEPTGLEPTMNDGDEQRDLILAGAPRWADPTQVMQVDPHPTEPIAVAWGGAPVPTTAPAIASPTTSPQAGTLAGTLALPEQPAQPAMSPPFPPFPPFPLGGYPTPSSNAEELQARLAAAEAALVDQAARAHRRNVILIAGVVLFTVAASVGAVVITSWNNQRGDAATPVLPVPTTAAPRSTAAPTTSPRSTAPSTTAPRSTAPSTTEPSSSAPAVPPAAPGNESTSGFDQWLDESGVGEYWDRIEKWSRDLEREADAWLNETFGGGR